MRLRVGEFSRLCQVPVKTLRYYDEIGLFMPAEIDRFSGYRYYALDQLPRIHRIMALKELGLSLEQIAQLLNDTLPFEDLREMFLSKQAEVQQRIQEEQERLALVKFHLHQIEQEATMPDLHIVIKKLEPFYALTLRKIFPTQSDIDRVGLEIMKAQMTGALNPVMLPMGIAYVEEFRRTDLDYEFVLPIDSSAISPVPLEHYGILAPRLVEGMEIAAAYIHQGDYDGLATATIGLQRWVVENGYTMGSEMRMIYFRGPMHRVTPNEYLTELQHAIIKT